MRFQEPEVYQPRAERIYRELRSKILAVIPAADIQHVGSSAVPGVLSKGDVDIYVGVAPAQFADAIGALESLGFDVKMGSLRTQSLCPFEGQRDVGVQLVAKGSEFEFFITFRDLLLADEGLRAEYNALKRASTGLDPERYRAAKSAFIERVLRERKPPLG